MVKLPLNKIKPKENESLYSFLHRLALANHYEHLGSMFTEFKASAYDENCNEIHPDLFWVSFIKELLLKMKIDINSLVVNQFDELLEKRVRVTNRRRYYHRAHYHRYSTKFCPDCINEDFYHRIYWDVSYVTICTNHKKDLLTNCPTCGEVIRLSRLMRNKCRCGKKYTTMGAEEADSVSIKVQSIFQKILLGNQKKILRSDRRWLSKDEYFEFFNYFNLLIKGINLKTFSFSNKSQIKGNVKSMKDLELEELKLIVNTIHLLILNPMKNFPRLIDSASEIGKGLSYFPKRKSNRYKYFNSIFKHPKGLYYYKIYTEYLNNKTDEYINRRFMLPPLEKGTKYLPAYKAIKLLKTEYTTLMNLCEHNLIKIHETLKDGKKIVLIERDSILKYQNMKKNHFTLDQCTKYLGLNFTHLKELIKLNFIAVTHGPSVDGYQTWYIPKSEIFRFERNIKEKCLPMSFFKGKEGLSIQQTCFKLRRSKISVGEVYQFIFNGRLRIFINENSRLIDGIKIYVEDVRTLDRELYYKRIDEKGYFGKEIQRALMIGPKKLNILLEDHVLKIDSLVRDGNHPPKKYIKKNQIINYLEKHRGLNKRSISKHLKKVEKFFEPRI